MKKYYIWPWLYSFNIGKLNKQGNWFSDKESLTKSEVIHLLVDCINFLLDSENNYLEITRAGSVDFKIQRCTKS